MLNLVNHGWVFQEFQGPRLTKHIPTCMINIDGFQEIENRGVKFGDFRAEYMSIHMKKGAVCISPNNQKVLIDTTIPINKAWVVCLGEDGTATVTYYWLLTTPDLVPGFLSPTNLGELLGFLGDHELDQVFNGAN